MAKGHAWQTGRFTGTMTCSKCRLLPLDDEDVNTTCPVDWVEHEAGLHDAGDIGGDIQVGTAWSRVFTRRSPSNPGRFDRIEIAAYATQEEGQDGYDVQQQTCVIECTDLADPGSSETDSGYEYEYLNDLTMTAADEAEAYAKRWVRDLDPERDLI